MALDYYMSGIKIERSHFECIYNIGCTFYRVKKYKNAKKWFKIAMKVD
jgi:hypothetical protein